MSDGSFNERMKRGLLGGRTAWRFPLSTSRMTSASGSAKPVAATQLQAVTVSSLCDGERGAVWSSLPANTFPAPGEFHLKPLTPDLEAIRTAILFFDVFDFGDQNAIGFDDPERAEFESVGLVRSSRFVGNGDAATIVQRLPWEVFKAHEEREPGRWTLSRTAQNLGFPADELLPGRGFALALSNALPIFAREVAIADVLEFKQRRRSELLSLREHLDKLCRELGAHNLNSFEHNSTFEQFDRALADHVKTMNESPLNKVWRSLKASCDWTSMVPVGVEAVLEHTTAASGVIHGAATVALRTVAGLRRKRNSLNPFEYLTSANQELY